VRACLRGGGSIFRPTPDLFEVPISITYTSTRTQGLSLDPARRGFWGANLNQVQKKEEKEEEGWSIFRPT
jgi:hypothetical protein